MNILGADGKPILKILGDYKSSLDLVRSQPNSQALHPYQFHTWVYAGANAIARTAAQAALRVWKDENAPRLSGNERSAMKSLTLQKRLKMDVVDDHPLTSVLWKPNPYLNGSEMIFGTCIWLSIRGECFWVLTDEDGEGIPVNGKPKRIWPVPADLMEPLVIDGELTGWRYNPPRWMGPRYLIYDPHQVIQFKFVNPFDIRRGQSPLSAAANMILTDQQIGQYNRRLIEGGGVPKGVLHNESTLAPEKEEEFRRAWMEKFDSPEGTSRTALLTGGWEYTPVSMSPKDMEYMKTMEWDRDAVLAVLGVPKGMVGVTDSINYATQLGQDRIFIEKTVMFYWKAIEFAIDGSLFFTESDKLYPAFDLRGIEALRAGFDEKVSTVEKLMGGSIKMPAKQAFEMVGLEVEDYEPDEVKDPEPEPEDKLSKVSKAAKVNAFIETEEALEAGFISAYRAWIAETEAEVVKAYNRVTKFTIVEIFDLVKIQNSLREHTRPKYTKALHSTFAMTMKEVKGVALIDVDDPGLVDYFELREKRFVESTPVTLKRNLVAAIEKGQKAGENIGQIRLRIAQVFATTGSSSKALSVARTEMSNFMNGIRDRLFDAQGFTKMEWVTAGDEHVRANHRTYGAAGPQKRGFNYLTLTGQRGGLLRHPGDIECTLAGEIINCRCVQIPVE